MSKKLELRYEKTWYEEPPKPETGAYKFRVESLKSVSDRLPHWPGASGDDHFYEWEYDEPEGTPEYSGKLDDRQSICLKDILAAVEKHGLDPKHVFLTGSMAEDYLCVEVVHIRKLNEKEQLEEHQAQQARWEERQTERKVNEEQRLKWELESVQKRLADLQKK